MKKIIHIFLLLLVLDTHAQQPVYRHFTEDDGLPDNEIYYLYQDKRGIIWISTNSGLCRYNGQSFQYFSSPQLKAKSTGCIKEDAYGRIWCMNFTGQLFYVQNDSLVVVQLPGIENLNSLSPFIIGPHNELVISSSQGEIAIYTPQHSNTTAPPQYIKDTVLQQANGNPFYDSKGILWATQGKDNYAISYFDQKVKTFSNSDPGTANTISNSYIFEFNKRIFSFQREQRDLYINSGQRFDLFKQLNIPGIKSIEPLRNGSIAFCTNSGLFVADEKLNGTFIIDGLFKGQTISAFCEDNNGNLWVGTLTEGIYFIPKLGFNKILPASTNIDYNNITTMCAGPATSLVLGFLNGELGIIDERLNYKKLQQPNNFSTKTQFVYYSPELEMLNWHSDNIYQSRFSAPEKTIHPYRGVGYSSKDLVYIPKWNAALIANPVDVQILSLDKALISTKVPAGWIKNYETGVIFDNNMDWPQQSILLSKERGRAVYFDDATETAWGADKNGITLYNKNGRSSILIDKAPIYATTFCRHKGIVWAGTFSQGLVAIKDQKVVQQFTVNEGLASNTIYKVIGSNGHLWIYTDKGLQYFDTKTTKFYLLDKTTGLPSYKINGMALVGKTLFISTPKGLLSIADSATFEGIENNTVYLQAVYCNGLIVDPAITRFSSNQNDLVFKIETPAYTNRALMRYRYRLKGVEKDLITVNLDRSILEYKSLQSGNYEFELQLIDAKGNIIGKPVIYSFYIRPPFYRTIWFIGLCLVLLALLIFYLVRRRINQIKKRADEKLDKARLESELKQSQLSGIKAQMNPHFMFNALNSIQEFILLNDKKQANMYMGKFADLMRMTLDMSNKKEVQLEEEIRILQLYLELEALRFEEHFTYSIIVDDAVDKENSYLPAMLIQPNIENALKHGLLHKQGEKKLTVHFQLMDAHILRCTITDNGIGRKRSGEINAQRLNKHTSFATGATQKRLSLLNHDKTKPIEVIYKDLYDEHNNATGTEVIIHIPL